MEATMMEADPLGTADAAVGQTDLARIAAHSIDFRATGPWYAAHVTGRQEASFARKLVAKGIAAYAPVERVYKRVPRTGKGREGQTRRIEWDRPVFGGYAFFGGDCNAIYAARETGLLHNVIQDGNQHRLIKRLEDMARVFGSGDKFRVYDEALVSGKWCRVKAPHPLQGSEGILDIRKGRFFIPVEIFGQVIETLIEDPSFLEPM